jgi:non-heme chloroperoxidase
MAPHPEQLTFQGAGVRLAGERWRADDARGIVVLLHGGGQTRHSWKRTAERLATAGWSAIAVDARGHGDSDWHTAQDYTLDGFADDLVALVATLDEAPVLVGASLGGITALVAAGEHPGLARGLVLIDVVVEVEPRGAARILDFLTAHRDGFASLDDVADAIVAYNPIRRRPRNLEGLRKNVRQHADGRWYWHWDPAFVKIDDEPRRHVDPARLRAAAAGLRIPTLIVRGAESDVVSDAGMDDMLRLIAHAESVVVPGTGHMVTGDDNEAFVAGLEAFLTRID